MVSFQQAKAYRFERLVGGGDEIVAPLCNVSGDVFEAVVIKGDRQIGAVFRVFDTPGSYDIRDWVEWTRVAWVMQDGVERVWPCCQVESLERGDLQRCVLCWMP